MSPILPSQRVSHSLHQPNFDRGPHLFDLNTGGPGISIADQMRRGYNAAVEAIAEKYIAKDKPLLIIGAGVAGLMAAMTAVRDADVPTWILEARRELSTQANCPTRFVCPTQYDWPEKHWRTGHYPFDQTRMPFVWVQGAAGDVAKELIQSRFTLFKRDYPKLLNVFNFTFTDYACIKHRSGDWWVVPRLDTVETPKNFPGSFAMVLACAGFGTENTKVGPPKGVAPLPSARIYVGHQFWAIDPYEDENPQLNLTSGSLPKVVISGAGDGALQDFLRIVVRPSALHAESVSAGLLYETVVQDLPSDIRSEIEEILSVVEREFRAALSSRVDASTKCEIHTAANAKHEQLILELSRLQTIWSLIRRELDKLVKDPRTEIVVKLVHRCDHLTPYYGLNRFLTLLIRAYAKERYPAVEIFQPMMAITGIVEAEGLSRSSHTCGLADICHDQDHQVYWNVADCMTIKDGGLDDQKELTGGPYNVVVIRHGIVPGSRIDLLGQH